MAERSVVVRLRAEIGNFRSDMAAAAAAATATGTATAGAGRTIVGAMTQAQDAAATTRKELFDIGKAAQESAQGFGLSYNAAGRLTDQFGNVATEAHAAELGLATASDATQEYAAQTAAAAAGAAQATVASRSSIDSLIASASENEEAWSTAGTSLLAFGGAAVAGVGLAIHKFAEFDQAMSEVRASTHETAGNMDLLREAAIDAGADTAFSAKEAAQGIDELAKAGVSTKDILNGGLTGALSLAAAGSLGVGESAEIAATALTQFKLAGTDIPHVADLLAAGAGKAQGSVQDMGMALKQAGLVASQTGLTIEETTGGLAAFASAGLVGSDAGTSFKSMLQRLTPQSKEAQAKMDELGISAYDASGKFIGLSAFSGQLQNAMKGLDSESRNAALGVIFGSDAVRAANVLYEKGSTGIQGWIDAVDDAGFAAATASIKQDNLAGDIEKLGGSFDTVLIKGGEGAAQSLRGIVQGAEDLVDLLGKVKPEMLQLGVGLIGTAGGAALLGGAFLTMLPKVLSARDAFRTLQTTNGPLASGLGKVGKAAGIATVALLALSAAGAIFGDKEVKTASDYANAILQVGSAGKAAKSSDLDSVFQGWDKFGGKETVQNIDSVSAAIDKLTNHGSQENINQFFDGFTGFLNLPKSELGQIEERLKGLGSELGNLANNGGAAAAAKSFNLLTEEFKKNGQGAQDALDKMPAYKESLLGVAHAAGVDLNAEELLEFAQGKIPARLAAAQKSTENAAAATEEAAKQTETLSAGLEEIGVSAQGAITNLDTFTQSLVAAGLLTLSSRDAARGYNETLDAFSASLAKNGQNLDITTKAGRDNEAALDAIAKSGIAVAESIAKNSASYGTNAEAQAAVQDALKKTYTDLVNGYTAMGKSSEEADALTRGILRIPPGVNIDTWMADTARQKAADTKAAIDAIPKKTDIYVNTFENIVRSINEETHISEGRGGRGGMDPGRWTGGLVGFAGGGIVPGVPPSNPRVDNVFARTQNGSAYKIRSGEMIVNEQATKQNYPLLKAINDGTYQAPSKSLAGGYGVGMSRSAYAPSVGGSGASQAVENHFHFDVSAPVGVSPEVAARSMFEVAMRGARR
ncbi:phage tail tape measure protein [Arthrobacter cryoconiti]|uniref:Phage tail tape measure protein n=1 Tax=Arthrobacter cryoconiti TaxID=748907 RepID=A0ABV8QWG3_9MICC|nr:phage tail tape measure protein [Arthrobacter cryoconiti]MCC9068793.1 phage tail tape measure protein [Arthrobacter cryoconiti]